MSSENRIYLRLTDGKREQLLDWADQQGRPYTNLASWLVEKAIDAAITSGEYRPSIQPTEVSEEGGVTEHSKSVLESISKGLPCSQGDLIRAAHELGLEPEVIINIQQRTLQRKIGNGAT